MLDPSLVVENEAAARNASTPCAQKLAICSHNHVEPAATMTQPGAPPADIPTGSPAPIARPHPQVSGGEATPNSSATTPAVASKTFLDFLTEHFEAMRL